LATLLEDDRTILGALAFSFLSGAAIVLYLSGGSKGGGKPEDEGPVAKATQAKAAPKAAPPATAGSAAGIKKKKKKARKGKAPAAAAKGAKKEEVPPAPVPAAAAAAAEEEELAAAPAPAPAQAPDAVGKKKKKKKKKGKGANGANGANKAEVAKKEGDGAADAAAATEEAASVKLAMELEREGEAAPAQADDGGWETVDDNKKKQQRQKAKKKAKAEAAAAASSSAPAIPAGETSVTVKVEARKVGIIIGPKGATMNALQAATGTKLEVNAPKAEDGSVSNNPAAVVVTGPTEGVGRARTAIKELCAKGYALELQEDGFIEASVAVHPSMLSELVGTKGATIRALQDGCNVKLTIPSSDWRPGDHGVFKPAQVGIAGKREDCAKAKEAIQSIVRYHHHPITHPGLIHEEVDIEPEYYHAVIGTRGAEIRHIRGNFGCDVHIPNDDSFSQCVIVVGKSDMVGKAVAHIDNLIIRSNQRRERKFDDDDDEEY